MKALLFDGPAPDAGRTRVATVPEPTPGPGEIAIDVRYAGVNFKDVMARRGDPGYVPSWPFTPGLEAAGVVRACGAGVDGLPPGTPVVAFTGAGGLAEVALAQAALTVPVAPGTDLRTAAAVPGAPATAVLLLDGAGRVRAGDALLVHSAAGAVGQSLAQVARRRGVGVLVGTVGAPSRVPQARRAGYDVVLVRGDDLAAQVAAAAPHGVDLVLDPQGTAFIGPDLAVLAPHGRVVVFGNAAGGALTDPPGWRDLLSRNAAVAGFSLESLAHSAPAVVAAAMRTVLADGAPGLPITDVDGLAAAPAAQDALAHGAGAGKYVVRVA